MRLDKNKLLVLLNKVPQMDAPQAAQSAGVPQPMPWGVLYQHPNPDGSRKLCATCVMWARTEQCLIHAPHIYAGADMVCGYYVNGHPHDEYEAHGADPVDPDISGLIQAPEGGVSCDRCRYFSPNASGGLCAAVADPATGQPPVPVESLGCCARWTERGGADVGTDY